MSCVESRESIFSNIAEEEVSLESSMCTTTQKSKKSGESNIGDLIEESNMINEVEYSYNSSLYDGFIFFTKFGFAIFS